jgi:hypothetical protein
MKILYKIDKENKTVVAYFEGGKDAWVDAIIKEAFRLERVTNNVIRFDLQYIVEQAEKVLNDMNLFGKAKCHPEDTFNPDVGAKMASRRLLDKLAKVKAQVFNKLQIKVNNLNWELIK